MDWWNEEAGIVDLKTCADLTWFESDMRRFGYAYQMAFYQMVVTAAGVAKLPHVHIVAVEKQVPYRTGVWQLMPEVLYEAANRNEAAINRLLECEQDNHWPTGWEDIRPVVEL